MQEIKPGVAKRVKRKRICQVYNILLNAKQSADFCSLVSVLIIYFLASVNHILCVQFSRVGTKL